MVINRMRRDAIIETAEVEPELEAEEDELMLHLRRNEIASLF